MLKDGENIINCFKLLDTDFHIVAILFKCYLCTLWSDNIIKLKNTNWEFHICFDHIHVFFQLSLDPFCFPINPSLCVSFIFNTHQDQFVLFRCFWMCGLPLECDRLIRDYTRRENVISFAPQLTMLIASWSRLGFPSPTHISKLGFGLCWLSQDLCT